MTGPGAASAAVVAGHLGGLHPYEQLLVLALAFGPFAVLGVVVAVQRRRAVAAEAAEPRGERAEPPAEGPANGPGTPDRPGSPPSGP